MGSEKETHGKEGGDNRQSNQGFSYDTRDILQRKEGEVTQPSEGIYIPVSEMYKAILTTGQEMNSLSSAVVALGEVVKNGQADHDREYQDHETRLRVVEAWRNRLPTALILSGVAGIVSAVGLILELKR
jgi:hypothetical protein